MEQNTNAWLEFRKKGLGASDSPIVLGVSPWKTRYQLWEEKTGAATAPSVSTWATRRGHELEPKARADYELNYGIDMPPALVQHKDYPFIRASLDGWNPEKKIILEIKCPGKDDHAKALNGEIPDKYYPQLQHQILATGASGVHYYSFLDDKGVLVKVEPDNNYITNKLFPALVEFWDLVQTKTAPELSDRDWKEIRGRDLKMRIDNWKIIKKNLDKMAAEEDRIKKEILAELDKHPRWRTDTVEITKSFRSGAVDYSKVPELKNIDLNQYRKPGSEYWTVRVKK